MIRDTVAFKPIYQAVDDFAKATQAYRTALALSMPVDAVLDASERNAKKLEDAITAYAAAEVAKERERCAEIADGYAMLAFASGAAAFLACAAEIRHPAKG